MKEFVKNIIGVVFVLPVVIVTSFVVSILYYFTDNSTGKLSFVS